MFWCISSVEFVECCRLRSGRTDRDVVVQEEIENKKEYLESVKARNSQSRNMPKSGKVRAIWNGPLSLI